MTLLGTEEIVAKFTRPDRLGSDRQPGSLEYLMESESLSFSYEMNIIELANKVSAS